MNQDIKAAAKTANVRLWRIADRLELTDGNFSKKLRKELPAEEKERILKIIEELEKEGC